MDLPRELAGEALGTALLLPIVIGSGVMAEPLAGGNVAVALLANTLAPSSARAVCDHGAPIGLDLHNALEPPLHPAAYHNVIEASGDEGEMLVGELGSVLTRGRDP